MSGFYIGVDGKARKVKGAYIGVDGVARKVKKGYIGDENGVARLCWSAFDGDPVFANNSWEKIIEACQTGNVPDTWNVGDKKAIRVNTIDYEIAIIGKNHDDYADGSGKAPLTLQFYGCYGMSSAMNTSDTNIGGWETSDMRTSKMPNILEKMPTAVRNAIREVSKLTSAGNKSSKIITTSDKLFLLSEVEVFGTTNNSFSGEGAQYEYYKTAPSRVKQYNDSPQDWWERSPRKSNTTHFCRVNADGAANSGFASSFNYVAPAFCF